MKNKINLHHRFLHLTKKMKKRTKSAYAFASEKNKQIKNRKLRIYISPH